MYKLVAIDLDGTMLNSYGEVTESTKRTIKEIQEMGINVVIASGRTIDSIKAIAEDINANKYIIAGNGAVLYNMQEEQIMYEKYISRLKALNIIDICEQNSITYSVYTNKTIVANSLKYNILYYYKENLKKDEKKKTSIKIVENIYEYVKNMPKEEKVMKIFICDKNKAVFNSILRKLNEVKDIEILDVSHMSRKIIKSGSEEVMIEYYYTEVSEKNVDKWYAIEHLTNTIDIDKKEVVAIGDNINDKIMIEKSGLGVAMKGSTPKLTEVADTITEADNNNEGVSLTLKRIFLE